MPPTGKSVTVFFPAYNDGGTIASMVLSALIVLEQLTDDYEVVVINDASRDYTPEILARLAADYERVRVIHHPQNRGYGGALKTGFAAATKDLVFYTDGDAQYDVHDLVRLWEIMDDDVDVANGYKRRRHDPWYRKLIGWSYQRFTRIAFRLPIRDVDCDFRLIRRAKLQEITLESDSGVICVEMIRKLHDAGARFAEAPVSHLHRAYGGSQFFTLPKVMRALVGLACMWFKLMVRKEHVKHRQIQQGEASAECGVSTQAVEDT
jgi:glycosyltransferase involved in cell wall biosynthesis